MSGHDEGVEDDNEDDGDAEVKVDGALSLETVAVKKVRIRKE